MMKIETKRLILRTPTTDDFEFLKNMWENGEVMKFVGWPNGLKQPDKNIYDWIESALALSKCKRGCEGQNSVKLKNGTSRSRIVPLCIERENLA